ncbi:DegT/DnrJ/EryC1/StrS family aminotransferase [Kitasatospora viridis]|uniref:dTDP-4-amino-4,6-dideoxygalactose transaminase n=1 Tax=Kitasatospora viridis TaxID=281105 RepID=A0A561UHW0_9ACTN|nr:DegT/DnrJ/EryC1/StrS family aminotransferase [Kitasatospora viridis]TWF98943.1 dTDP-4-amino-4,6-dideoxygalactose transaminase [Kitasatospora viridis]
MRTSSEPVATGRATGRWARLTAAGPRPLPERAAEFEAWRREVRGAVRRLGGAGLDPVAGTGARLVAAREAGGLVREEYLLGGPEDTVRVIATRPAGTAERLPAVVVCPGRGAVPDQVTGAVPPDHPDRNVAEHFARAGFLTLTLDYGFAGCVDPARLHGRDEAELLAQLLGQQGRPLLGVLAGDALRVLDWLPRHPHALPGRTALFGHSLGGAVALHAALAAERPVPLCVASHLGSYRVLGLGHGASVLPGLAAHADLPELFAALAPAPLHLQYGLADQALEPADSAAAGETVRALYQVAGAAGLAEVLALPMGHGTGVEEAIGFLKRVLDGPADEQGPPPVAPIRVGFTRAARAEVTAAIEQTLDSGVLTIGPLVARFEAELAPWAGGPTVAVDSGSSALEIALRDIGVTGRTVLVPVNTFIATAAGALRAGASVDFVDLEPDGLGLCPDSLRERLDQHGGSVAAVIAMHTGGYVSPLLPRVVEECHRRGIPVIEDAAHAFGSSLGGKRAGSIADYGTYSFYPTKVLTSAEGGAVTAADPARTEAFLRLRDHGRVRPGATLHDSLGSNWRLSEVHAAVGLAQLRRFAERTAARARLAARYDEQLAGLAGLRVQPVPEGSTTSWYKYLVHLDEGVDRAELKARLRAEHGIALAGEVYDLLLCDQPYFAAGFGGRAFPQAREFADRHACLPLYPELTEGEQDRVVRALHEVLG